MAPRSGWIKFELSEPPEGISLVRVSQTSDGTELEFAANAKTKSGLEGNFIVNVLAERPRGNQKSQGQPNGGRVPVSVLPAIPVEVIGR